MEKQIPDENKKADRKSHKRLIWLIFILMILLFLFWFSTDFGNGYAPNAEKNAKIQAYLRQIKDFAKIYYGSNGNYNNFNKSVGYVESCDNIIKKVTNKSYCLSQINEKSYCVKAKFVLDGKEEIYWCVDGNYDGRVTSDYCTSEKPYCTEQPSLPQGYTLNKYSIEKELDVICQKHTDCATPVEYSVQSRCPFVSLCLEGSCTVVCPAQEN